MSKHSEILQLLMEQFASGEPETRVLLADSYIQNGETARGIESFEEVLKQGDEIPADLMNRLHSSFLIALQYQSGITASALRDAAGKWAEIYRMSHSERAAGLANRIAQLPV